MGLASYVVKSSIFETVALDLHASQPESDNLARFEQGKQLAEVKISMAEKKILVTLCYYTLLHFTTSALYTYMGSKFEQFDAELNAYFQCASVNRKCGPPQFFQTSISLVGAMIPWFLLTCLPLFLLVYVIDCQQFKKSVKKRSADLSTHWASIKSQTSAKPQAV